MDTKKGPLDDLTKCAKEFAGAAPLKAIVLVGKVLEAQRKVVEFELGLLDDAIQVVKKFTSPPAASKS
jgi:hypothetical protein